MLIESGIRLKNHVRAYMLVVIDAKTLHHSFIPAIYENFKSVI